MSSEKNNSLTALLFFAILALAIASRLVYLTWLPGLMGDEAWHGAQAKLFLDGGNWQWINPSEKLLNPFYFLISVLCEWLLPSSVFAIRLPGLISGLLLIVFFYVFAKPAVGKRPALLGTLLVACLPIFIFYSRLGLEAGQNFLPGILVGSFLLRRNIKMAWGSLLICLLIHPTSIFLAPVAFIFTLDCYGKKIQPKMGLLLTLILTGGLGFVISLSPQALSRIELSRMFKLPGFVAFVLQFINYVTGREIIKGAYNSLPHSLFYVHGLLLFMIVVGVGLYFFKNRKVLSSVRDETMLLAGILLGLLGLWVTDGVLMRYFACLIPLVIYFVCLVYKKALVKSPKFIYSLETGGVAALFLILFVPYVTLCIFDLAKAVRANGKEYRYSAALWSSEHVPEKNTILTEDWNSYWFLVYFLPEYKKIRVSNVFSGAKTLEELDCLMNQSQFVLLGPDPFLEEIISRRYVSGVEAVEKKLLKLTQANVSTSWKKLDKEFELTEESCLHFKCLIEKDFLRNYKKKAFSVLGNAKKNPPPTG